MSFINKTTLFGLINKQMSESKYKSGAFKIRPSSRNIQLFWYLWSESPARAAVTWSQQNSSSRTGIQFTSICAKHKVESLVFFFFFSLDVIFKQFGGTGKRSSSSVPERFPPELDKNNVSWVAAAANVIQRSRVDSSWTQPPLVHVQRHTPTPPHPPWDMCPVSSEAF